MSNLSRVCSPIKPPPTLYTYTYVGGFYFVRVMKFYSELCLAKRYDFGCNFWGREGRENKLHSKLYILAFLCLPWSQTKYILYVAIYIYIYIYIYKHACMSYDIIRQTMVDVSRKSQTAAHQNCIERISIIGGQRHALALHASSHTIYMRNLRGWLETRLAQNPLN